MAIDEARDGGEVTSTKPCWLLVTLETAYNPQSKAAVQCAIYSASSVHAPEHRQLTVAAASAWVPVVPINPAAMQHTRSLSSSCSCSYTSSNGAFGRSHHANRRPAQAASTRRRRQLVTRVSTPSGTDCARLPCVPQQACDACIHRAYYWQWAMQGISEHAQQQQASHFHKQYVSHGILLGLDKQLMSSESSCL